MLEKHLASKPSLESEACLLDSVESPPQASYSPPMVKKTGPTVTIVVCTRNRPEALRCCLEAIARLTPPADEVLVVDNSQGDAETERVARELAARYVVERRAGLSRARNRGLAESRTEIVAFVDDDAIPSEDWLGKILTPLR